MAVVSCDMPLESESAEAAVELVQVAVAGTRPPVEEVLGCDGTTWTLAAVHGNGVLRPTEAGAALFALPEGRGPS